jgi:hypothetical protein
MAEEPVRGMPVKEKKAAATLVHEVVPCEEYERAQGVASRMP